MLHPWELTVTCQAKPLSINRAHYKNKQKSMAYREYEDDWQSTLNGLSIPEDIEIKDMQFFIYYEWGFSSKLADVDNPIKPCQDILQRWFGFDDRQVWHVEAKKKIVPKGSEYAKVRIVEVFHEDFKYE